VKKNDVRPKVAAAPRRINRDLADQMAIQALGFLAEDPDRLGRFFDITGLTIQTLRQVAGTSSFTSSLLDYLGSDEALLRAFAERNGYDPAEVDAARLPLSGPQDDWQG
jgi:hypothetical protein